jgi:hypothetical protein
MPKYPETACAHCGKNFRPKQQRQRFCCDWCRKATFDRTHGRVSSDPRCRARRQLMRERQRLDEGRRKRRRTHLPEIVENEVKNQVKQMSYKGVVGPFRGVGIEAGPAAISRSLWRAILAAELANVPLVAVADPALFREAAE